MVFKRGGSQRQINFILTKRSDNATFKDDNVIPGEDLTIQSRLVLLHVERKNGVKIEKRDMQPDFNVHTKRLKPLNIQGQAIGGWSMGLRGRDEIYRSKCKLHLYCI